MELILKSNIDFTKQGWGIKLGEILHKSPQRSVVIVKKLCPDIWFKAWKHGENKITL
jgi:hypothetical protein